MVDRKKTLELKKHVATIHSSNKLSLLQRKIANALLFNAYDDLLVKDEYEIHIATLCNLIGYDSHDHKTIKKSLVNLLATVIEWNLIDGDKVDTPGIWNASSIIADASIDGPICTYSYSNKMKKLLHRPELYGRLNMLVQAKFQSTYGLALYENCIRFQGIEQTPWLEIGKFRKLMGVEEGKYKIFRDFKNRVLDKAVAEVNQYSPIFVTPQFRKQGRQVISIQFMIQSSKLSPLDTSEQKKGADIIGILKLQFGLSKKQIDNVLTQYEESYVREKIAIIESSASFLKGKIHNLARYLICALKEDYQPTKTTKEKPPQLRASVTSAAETHARKQDWADDYRKHQHQEIMQMVDRQTEQEKRLIFEEFQKYLGKSIYLDIYLRDGISNILIQDQLCLFIKQKKPELITTIVSYHEFCQQKKQTVTVFHIEQEN